MSDRNDVDLEIGLSWDRQADALRSYLRLDRKGTATDEWEQVERLIALDLPGLRELEPDADEYGTVLGETLLGPQDIGRAHTKARLLTEADDARLHVRLHMKAPAQFHAVRWETIRDPESGHRIATQSGVLFSRYLSSADWRPVPARPKHKLRGLAVVSAPNDVQKLTRNGHPLALVDRDKELERARAALGDIQVPDLAARRACLAEMLDAVEAGVDVLYLVCHGRLSDGVPQLVLEDPSGNADLVDGRVLVERLSELEDRPTVVLLCSCQSATRGDELWTADAGELSALGPRLAAAGVAAVVAMQGDVSIKSAGIFGERFFEELKDHGQVDRAMAAARRAIQDERDWWVPVLYTRLRSGRTYYLPQFSQDGEGIWDSLRLAMERGRLTPVLGPGLADSILASRQELASLWAERLQLPIAANARGDLAQVAQYLRVRSTAWGPRDRLLLHLEHEMQERSNKAKQGQPFHELQVDRRDLQAAILEVGKRLRTKPDDPYRVAASLPVDVFVTTAWTDLLQEALIDAGKDPITMRFRWNESTDPPAPEDVVQPTEKCPLVYHLFGHLANEESLVLTEDDYFAWLAAWLQKGKDVPAVVQKALIRRSLLFLGFRLDDWDFRVVFHAIKSFGGSAKLRESQHVGVQLGAESPMIEPESAQEYLESYFGVDMVHIYWGETAEFLSDFRSETQLVT